MVINAKKLMSKAAEFALEKTANHPYTFENVYIEKYTELIVMECARISEEADDTMTGQGAASAEAFKKHFGIQ